MYIGVLGSVAQQLILFVGAAVLWASRRGPVPPGTVRTASWAFGRCSIDLGLAHLTGLHPVAAMVSLWMPMGGAFWVALTGVAFVLAGLAIIGGVLDVLAARLLGVMLLVFSAVLLTPGIFAAPGNHVALGRRRIQPDRSRGIVDHGEVVGRAGTVGKERTEDDGRGVCCREGSDAVRLAQMCSTGFDASMHVPQPMSNVHSRL